jgi:hypothetical protein
MSSSRNVDISLLLARVTRETYNVRLYARNARVANAEGADRHADERGDAEHGLPPALPRSLVRGLSWA